jgi:hypothetical protein
VRSIVPIARAAQRISFSLFSSREKFADADFEDQMIAVVNEWELLDSLYHAAMSNHVSRRASQATGSALLRVASQVLAVIPSVNMCLLSFHI